MNYILYVKNPTDTERKITGSIKIKKLTNKKYAIGELSGLVNSRVIEPLQGLNYILNHPDEQLINEMIKLLTSACISRYGIDLTDRLLVEDSRENSVIGINSSRIYSLNVSIANKLSSEELGVIFDYIRPFDFEFTSEELTLLSDEFLEGDFYGSDGYNTVLDPKPPEPPAPDPSNIYTILIAGLETDKNLSQQIEIAKRSIGSYSNLKGFSWNAKKQDIYDEIAKNPNSVIIMFSKGSERASEISMAPSVNKDRIYIIEPWNNVKTGYGTKVIVNNAINNGIPAKNVFVGTKPTNDPNRGYGIAIGESSSNVNDHWAALGNIGNLVKEYNNLNNVV
jgi:hypothetical protein